LICNCGKTEASRKSTTIDCDIKVVPVDCGIKNITIDCDIKVVPVDCGKKNMPIDSQLFIFYH
jgi:hypothetical protein